MANQQKASQPQVPQAHATQLQQAGCSQDDCNKLAALPGINWANILTLVQKYGPMIVSIILAAAGGGTLPALPDTLGGQGSKP